MVLTWIDYVVIGGYLLAITAFGSTFARFQKTTRDYFLNDRSVPWWAICFTIVATETSTLSFIGVPAQTFAGNMTFLQLAMGYIIGRILVSVLFIPAYFRGELFTSYELLQRRFGPDVKNIAALIFVVTRTLADGVRLFATALEPAEVLSEIRNPVPPTSSGGAYGKLERKVGDFATAGVAAFLVLKGGTIERAGIGLTNVGPTPIKAAAAEKSLAGKKAAEEAFAEAGRLAAAAASPSADRRGSVEYKKEMARVLTIRALRKAAQRAEGR